MTMQRTDVSFAVEMKSSLSLELDVAIVYLNWSFRIKNFSKRSKTYRKSLRVKYFFNVATTFSSTRYLSWGIKAWPVASAREKVNLPLEYLTAFVRQKWQAEWRQPSRTLGFASSVNLRRHVWHLILSIGETKASHLMKHTISRFKHTFWNQKHYRSLLMLLHKALPSRQFCCKSLECVSNYWKDCEDGLKLRFNLYITWFDLAIGTWPGWNNIFQ